MHQVNVRAASGEGRKSATGGFALIAAGGAANVKVKSVPNAKPRHMTCCATRDFARIVAPAASHVPANDVLNVGQRVWIYCANVASAKNVAGDATHVLGQCALAVGLEQSSSAREAFATVAAMGVTDALSLLLVSPPKRGVIPQMSCHPAPP